MTGAATRTALAGVLFLGLTAAPEVSAATPQNAYVTVAVATVWTSPQSPRPVDHPALTNPVDIRGWVSAMTQDQQEALTSDELDQTQVLYGDRVIVVREQGDWDEVRVPDQATPKDSQGYPGWIPRSQLAIDAGYGALKGYGPFALADHGKTTWLYRDPGLADKDLEISANTRLPILNRTDKAIQVSTPDRGPKWLDAQAAMVYQKSTDIPHPTGADVVRYAATFLGIPYVWGGWSGFGIDCSGLTATAYEVHGITLPRDAGPQAADIRGRVVEKTALQPGDLLFYSNDLKNPADYDAIHHVAMYYGDGTMIEAFDKSEPVRITPVRLDGDYWGARRYLN